MSAEILEQQQTKLGEARQAALAYLDPDTIQDVAPTASTPNGANSEYTQASQTLEVDTTDPEALAGTVAAIIETGIPEPGNVADASRRRTLEVIKGLAIPEVTALLEQSDMVACAKFLKLVNSLYRIEDSSNPGAPSDYKIVDCTPEYKGKPELAAQARTEMTALMSKSSVELVASGSPVQPLLCARNYTPRGGSEISTSEETFTLSDEAYLKAAKEIVNGPTQPHYVVKSLNELIRLSLKEGNHTVQSKMVAEALQVSESEFGIFLKSYLSTSTEATAYLGLSTEYLVQQPDGKLSLNLENMFKAQAARISFRAQKLLAGRETVEPGDRESVKNFVKTSLRVLESLGDYEHRLDIERLVLDAAGEYSVDQSRLYQQEVLGEITYTAWLNGREKQQVLTDEHLRLPEITPEDGEEEKLGILSAITSKNRRLLLKDNPQLLAQEAALARDLAQQLVANNPGLQEVIAGRMTDYYSALGGQYLSAAETSLGQVRNETSRQQLSKSLDLARALEGTGLRELSALQATKLTEGSKPTEYSLTDRQQELARKLVEKASQKKALVTLLIDDPEVLIDILLGDGRVKTMWETRVTNGVTGGDIHATDERDSTYLQRRMLAEQVMEMDDHIDHPGLLEPPVSALAMVTRRVPASAAKYGFIEIGLKNESIRDRTLFVDGDSANEAEETKPDFMTWDDAIKTAANKAVLVRDGDIEPEMDSSAPKKGWDYVEAMVLGGVSKEDIGTVTIRTRDYISEEEALKLKGIIESRVEGIRVEVAR